MDLFINPPTEATVTPVSQTKQHGSVKTRNITFNAAFQAALAVCAACKMCNRLFFLTATALFPELVTEQPAILMKAQNR